MTTAYSLTDTLPKDVGGQKFSAWVNDQTSQLDFALPKAIGTSTIGSKLLGHLAVGTHTQASKVESLHPFMLLGGVYTEYDSTVQTSPVLGGRGKIAHINNWGELFAVPRPKTASLIQASGSRDTVKASSGVVHSFVLAYNDSNPGGFATIKNGTADLFTIVIAGTSGLVNAAIPPGGVGFSDSIVVDKTITGGGNASIMITYS